MKPIAEQGYVIVACNSATVDYVDCARSLATTLKMHNPAAEICLVTDSEYRDPVFDHVRCITNVNPANPYENDWQAFYQTPFRETIKLEADMWIVSNIDHWWDMFRHRDLLISTGCRTWRDQDSHNRRYRKIFDDNNLPDVYNAITYWRLSETAKEFFDTVRNIFENWTEYRKLLKFPEDIPSTDLVYAMAANIIGADRCTMPFASYPQIIHMKRYHAGSQTEAWLNEFVFEYKNYMVRINTIAQWGALHYRVKEWTHD